MPKSGRKTNQNNPMMEFSKIFFYGTLGSLAAVTATALLSLIFFIPGYLLITKYNKPGSKTLEELQTQQYIGIILCGIGMLPWIRYIFAGFGLEVGSALFDSLNE